MIGGTSACPNPTAVTVSPLAAVNTQAEPGPGSEMRFTAASYSTVYRPSLVALPVPTPGTDVVGKVNRVVLNTLQAAFERHLGARGGRRGGGEAGQRDQDDSKSGERGAHSGRHRCSSSVDELPVLSNVVHRLLPLRAVRVLPGPNRLRSPKSKAPRSVRLAEEAVSVNTYRWPQRTPGAQLRHRLNPFHLEGAPRSRAGPTSQRV